MKSRRSGVGGLDGDPEGVVAGQELNVTAFAASKASDLARGGEVWCGWAVVVVERRDERELVARAEGESARVWRCGRYEVVVWVL